MEGSQASASGSLFPPENQLATFPGLGFPGETAGFPEEDSDLEDWEVRNSSMAEPRTWASTRVPLESSQTTLCRVSFGGEDLARVSLTVLMTPSLIAEEEEEEEKEGTSTLFCFFHMGWCRLANQLEGGGSVEAFSTLDCLLPVPWRIETSKLFERWSFSRRRFCSRLFEDSRSSPHRFISVAEDVSELRIEIRSVFEHTIPGDAPVRDRGNSEALLRDVDAWFVPDKEHDEIELEIAPKSEKRRCCWV